MIEIIFKSVANAGEKTLPFFCIGSGVQMPVASYGSLIAYLEAAERLKQRVAVSLRDVENSS